MNLREEVEDALLEALEEAGPNLPRVFSVEIPDDVWQRLAKIGSPVYLLGGFEMHLLSDRTHPSHERMTLPEWIAASQAENGYRENPSQLRETRPIPPPELLRRKK